MNQYLEKLEKIAAYRDDVMYMRTPLGRNGAGPNSPAIYAANQRARFGMSQEDRDLIRERNALRRAEREGMLGSRKATFSELEAMVANRKVKDNLARSAYDRYGLQNMNGPILNLTKTPIKSHPAMGPTGLRTVKYEGNWPVNPLSVPSMDVDYKTITQKGEVLNKLNENGPARRIAAAQEELNRNLSSSGSRLEAGLKALNKETERKLQQARQTVADTVSHSSPGLSTGAKIGLGAVGLGGLGLAAYAIHKHNQHQNEKRASEEDMNQYLEKIAAWHPSIFSKVDAPGAAWKSLRTIPAALHNPEVSRRLGNARRLQAQANDPQYVESARKTLAEVSTGWRRLADSDTRGLSTFVPDLRNKG